ncbi:MAG: hypothetical protein AABY33_05145 [Pseudomonadota bacterium]
MSYLSSQVASPLVYAGLLATMTYQGITQGYDNVSIKPPSFQTSSNSIFLNPLNVLENTIIDYFETKSEHGWDGYDAIPVTETSKKIALQIISNLPRNIQNPDIIPSAGGGYSIEWFAEQKILSIEIEDLEMSWSFVDAINKRKQSGYEKTFSGKFPNSISELLIKEFAA